MTEQSPLERAARAVFATDYPDYVSDGEILESGMAMWEKRHVWYLEAARAVLMAIRKPTKRMMFEGESYSGPREFDLRLAFTAMIDTALGE